MYKLGYSATRYFANNFIIPFDKAYGQEDRTEIKITIFTDDNVEGLQASDADLNLCDYDLKKLVNFYIEEYPVDKEDEGSRIDVVDALWNYDPFTGIWEDTLEIPDDLDSFHLCVQDRYTGQTVDCLEMDGSIFSDFLSLYNLLSELLAYGPDDF
jgi:hypothetical protein